MNNNEIRINPLVKVIRTGENSLLLKSENKRQVLESEKHIEFIELMLSNMDNWTESNELVTKYLDRERAILESFLLKLENMNFILYRSSEEA